ncbi:4-(cytidine 5'-diphospho)-2-C-methyl-D-erythritol kinase [Marimonas arenosa]|uniref:4-diphosphocytidyl-2-C-methyl-D-erythritol kinase n=1 Tax=Marimonas arenosa TaxID=1795305 RepID=A0AAE3WFX9_9RHOB|nr:4-(cytidine 5'-diphospho)-2-C-methyl-D-erythritol kinase [Marimonas arenosa]MDQ2091974.1 4-(cytidine 5'-diphospho)-2-C-methyl-D-erythritol kinase [Marimonas arenosa]
MADAGGPGHAPGFGPGFAPAKVNLTLHVTAQRADGLHELDSLVAFADIGDRLELAAAGRPLLSVTGPMAEGVPFDESNLVLRAAEWMGESAAFTLEKHLPAAAGIGGGSSDAAAGLRLLAERSGRPVPPGSEVLGADVPVCLHARAMRMRGIGERLAPVNLPVLPALLVNPRVAVPTGAVFAGLSSKTHPPMPEVIPEFDAVRDAVGWIARQRNDLEAPAIEIAPVIGEVLDRLAVLPGALLARMSGSGATCFALFEGVDQAKAAERAIRAARPAWWSVATRLF